MSIQRYLLTTIIAIVTLTSFHAALQSYKKSEQSLNELLNNEISAIAQLLLNQTELSSQLIETASETLVFQVWQHNQLRQKSVNAPTVAITQTQGFSEQNFNGDRWHVFVATTADKTVLVAQPVQYRLKLVESILISAMLPYIYAIIIIGFLVYFAVKSSLRPLVELSTQLQQKNADDLSTISVDKKPVELQPIEQTINHLLQRLKKAFEQEQQLSSNAAHELRTPISVLKLSSHNLQRNFISNSLTQADFDELKQNTDRMAHVVEQLINLNRMTPERFAQHKQKLALTPILQQVISQNFERIEQQQQTIELEAAACELVSDPFTLTCLFDNLISNAIKYSGQQAQIRVTVQSNNNDVVVNIDDSGPGIAATDREKVMQRFARLNQHQISGSGLGMSIIQHIVDLHQASLKLLDSDLGGLKVEIIFHGEDK